MKRVELAFLISALFVALDISAVSAGPVTITSAVTTEFGTYQPVSFAVTSSVAHYDIKDNFSNVVNIADFELTAEAKNYLASNSFAATASLYRQMYDVYNECENQGIPAFVTTDACLHTYHILYDYILRVLEKNYFITDLANLTEGMLKTLTVLHDEAAEQSVKDAALTTIAYLSVAKKLLDTNAVIDSRVADKVNGETSLINELSPGYVTSPLFYTDDYPFVEDYSQYKPRGHYTRTPELERYFRAMMWYGRITFSLNLPYATQTGLRKAAVQALLLCRALETGAIGNGIEGSLSVLWEGIYQPTVFFVGKTDDITHTQYIETAKKVFGDDFLTQFPDVLADEEKIDAFIAEALKLSDPKITVTAGKGYRFMGQRFIPDSYFLDQLVYEYVDGRFMPRGLDVMAVLGSARAYEIIDKFYKDPSLYSGYKEQVEKLKQECTGYAPVVWAQNLYFNWLYVLLPLLEVKGDGYPMFMRSTAWVDKDLNTALGSWAELRHDTILYAKQSETLETAEPLEPPLVKGYVEPAPEVYARLAALAGYMKQGLENRNLLDDLFEERLIAFENLMLDLKEIAVKELENTPLSTSEYALVCNFGGTIEDLVSFPPEFANQFQNDSDDFTAVIADVHTDPNNNECLEVGVGHPLTLYVIAPVNGVLTLTKGAIFSYHEFKRPLAEGRLNDEEWQKLQSGVNAVPMPEWTASFLAGDSSLKKETFHYHANNGVVTTIHDDTPQEYPLLANNPNPFNPSTMITYSVTKEGPVKLSVFNPAGQLVDVLVDEWCKTGIYRVTWSPKRGSASGVYFVRLVNAGHAETLKILFLK